MRKWRRNKTLWRSLKTLWQSCAYPFLLAKECARSIDSQVLNGFDIEIALLRRLCRPSRLHQAKFILLMYAKHVARSQGRGSKCNKWQTAAATKIARQSMQQRTRPGCQVAFAKRKANQPGQKWRIFWKGVKFWEKPTSMLKQMLLFEQPQSQSKSSLLQSLETQAASFALEQQLKARPGVIIEVCADKLRQNQTSVTQLGTPKLAEW